MTSRQRATLRSMANTMQPIFQIGKGGITPNIYKQFEDALEARELVKASVLNNADIPAKLVAQDIAEAIGADVVSVVGNRFVLYKESKKHKTIEL